MRLLFVLSTLLVAALAQGPGYETFPWLTNYSYRLHPERVPWETANKVCQLEGGHLIVINSEDEAAISNLLFGRIGAFNPPFSWGYDLMHAGITDKAEEGVWRTVLGEQLTDAGYNVWRNGEPNNYGNGEHCGAISRTGHYNDLRCNDDIHLCPFLCEKENTNADADVVAEYDIDIRDANNGTKAKF